MPTPLSPLNPSPYLLPDEPFRPHVEPNHQSCNSSCDKCYKRGLLINMWICPLPGGQTCNVLCDTCKTIRCDTPPPALIEAIENTSVPPVLGRWEKAAVSALISFAIAAIAYTSYRRKDNIGDLFVIGLLILCQQVIAHDPGIAMETDGDS